MSTLKAAFFLKNVPAWERALRFALGAAVVAVGLRSSGTLGVLALASGVMFAVTGVFGFCPLCAVAGRRLARKN